MTTTSLTAEPFTSAPEGVQRTTLDLPTTVHQSLKVYAATRGMSMRDVILSALANAGIISEAPQK